MTIGIPGNMTTVPVPCWAYSWWTGQWNKRAIKFNCNINTILFANRLLLFLLQEFVFPFIELARERAFPILFSVLTRESGSQRVIWSEEHSSRGRVISFIIIRCPLSIDWQQGKAKRWDPMVGRLIEQKEEVRNRSCLFRIVKRETLKCLIQWRNVPDSPINPFYDSFKDILGCPCVGDSILYDWEVNGWLPNQRLYDQHHPFASSSSS